MALPSHPIYPLEKDPLRRFLRSEPQTYDELRAAQSEMECVLGRYARELEAKFVKRALASACGNVTAAARAAGMNRTLFHKKLRDADGG